VVDARRTAAWLRGQYDKILAFAVLAALIGSLLYLVVSVGMIRSTKERLEKEIAGMRPAHEQASEQDGTAFHSAMASLREPYRLPAPAQPLLVPEARVWCTDCRLAIPYETEVCPFCGEKQKKGEAERDDYDGDKDGMYDAWERANKLDPYDPRDAGRDADHDGFPNIEEFQARTDPQDKNSCPSFIVKLKVRSIEINPFMLRFRGMMKRQDDSIRFQINTRVGGETYFRSLGETVEGFELHKFEEKHKELERHGTTIRDDVSELTLKRGDKMIVLVKGREVQYNEYLARLYFLLEKREIPVRIRDEFELRGIQFRVIDIDADKNRVVIGSLRDGKEHTLIK